MRVLVAPLAMAGERAHVTNEDAGMTKDGIAVVDTEMLTVVARIAPAPAGR